MGINIKEEMRNRGTVSRFILGFKSTSFLSLAEHCAFELPAHATHQGIQGSLPFSRTSNPPYAKICFWLPY